MIIITAQSVVAVNLDHVTQQKVYYENDLISLDYSSTFNRLVILYSTYFPGRFSHVAGYGGD